MRYSEIEIFAPISAVNNSKMVFGKIVSKVIASWSPINQKHFSCFFVPNPEVSHIHMFRSPVFDVVMCKVVSCCIVSFDRSLGLGMP